MTIARIGGLGSSREGYRQDTSNLIMEMEKRDSSLGRRGDTYRER